jgi:hypothetical protein
MLTLLVAVTLLAVLVAVPTVRMVRRGGAGAAGRALRTAAFGLAVVPAAGGLLEIGPGAAYRDLHFFIPAFVVPVLLAGVPAALPRSGSAVAPLTVGAALLLLWWTAASSLVGIGVLYWPAAAALSVAAAVEHAQYRRRKDARTRAGTDTGDHD